MTRISGSPSGSKPASGIVFTGWSIAFLAHSSRWIQSAKNAKREALASLASLALLALLTAAWQRLPSPDIPVPSVAPAGCRHLCSRSEDDPEVGDVADGAVAADAGGGAG